MTNPWRPQKKGLIRCSFRGMIYTDGIALSILKCNMEPTEARRGGRTNGASAPEEVPTLESLKLESLEQYSGRMVFVDPGRRDLLYCMGEQSTRDNRQVFRYTRNERSKDRKLRRYNQIRRKIKTDRIGMLERELHDSASVDPAAMRAFLERRSAVCSELRAFYTRPIFRKLKLSAYIRKQQNIQRLASNLKEKFGHNALFVWGNWSVPHQRYHEPIQGSGLRKALVALGFELVMLDEFRTSKYCPECHGPVSTFRRCRNPRPKATRRRIIRHGLLRCQSEACLREIPNGRLWNRDLLATLNFRHIVNGYREVGSRPERFRRPPRQVNQ